MDRHGTWSAHAHGVPAGALGKHCHRGHAMDGQHLVGFYSCVPWDQASISDFMGQFLGHVLRLVFLNHSQEPKEEGMFILGEEGGHVSC